MRPLKGRRQISQYDRAPAGFGPYRRLRWYKRYGSALLAGAIGVILGIILFWGWTK
jgi:hypothetical protein